MEKEETPNEPYVDLGENGSCLTCRKRYCTCKERQDGTWENNLPIINPLNSLDK